MKNKPADAKKVPNIVVLPGAEKPLFADMASAQLSLERGVLQFGMIDPLTGEQKIHTQIVMHPKGIMRLSKMLNEGIKQARDKEQMAKGPLPAGGEPN